MRVSLRTLAILACVLMIASACGEKKKGVCASGGKCCQATTGSLTDPVVSSFCVDDCSSCRALVFGETAACPATAGDMGGCIVEEPDLLADGDLGAFLVAKRSSSELSCDHECEAGNATCMPFIPGIKTQKAVSGITRILIAAKDKEVELPRADLLALFGVEHDLEDCPDSSVKLSRATAEVAGASDCLLTSTLDDDTGSIFTMNYSVETGTIASRHDTDRQLIFSFDKGKRPAIEFIEQGGKNRRASGWAIDKLYSSPESAVLRIDVDGEHSCMQYKFAGASR